MSGNLPDRCRACHAGITWIKTPAGKNMPVDTASRSQRIAIIGGVGVLSTTYVSHFETCPKAEQFRRAKR